jgi:hypothetical protein
MITIEIPNTTFYKNLFRLSSFLRTNKATIIAEFLPVFFAEAPMI